MKFNKLAGLGIASIVLFGSVGQLTLNAQPTQAQRAGLGTAKIVTVNGKRYLEFSKGFTTARGPKVRVVLHRNSTVPVNLNERNYVTLAALQRFDGAQRYEIPDNFDLDDFKSVAIWCEEFNVTFGFARLQGA